MTTTKKAGATAVLDNFSNYDYKSLFDSFTSPLIQPSWVGSESRRLSAYALLESYCKNTSRYWLKDEDDSKSDRREYGDPYIICETALVSLLGQDQKVMVQGSVEHEDGAVSVQDQIDQWCEDEKFFLKLIESERQSIKLGDSVYVLAPDAEKGRPRLHVYDPGFYFPVFDPLTRYGAEDFPMKVHIAWEFDKLDPAGKPRTYVRRITWELVKMEETYTTEYGTEADFNCQYTDAYWELDSVGTEVSIGWQSAKVFIQEPMWMNIDFLPVVHVPNNVSLQQHFGTSVLAPTMQILDDIQSTDTDLQAAAATTGTPPIAVSGRGGGTQQVESYGPGVIFYVGDGQATVLDTSMSLDALLKLKDALLERLSVNSRTPEALLGRVKPNEVPSGIAMTLSFAPHTGMIKEMRRVREEKYRILFKFVCRMLKIKDPPVIDLVLGSFLPADKQEAFTMVVQLLNSKAISLETAVKMLIESGVPIENWVDEIELIEKRDFEGASSLLALTGDPNQGLKYLHRPTIDISDNPLDDEEDTNATT